MISAVAKSELTTWLAAVSEETGVDLNQHADKLAEQGLTKSVMYDVNEDEWSDIDIPLGHRIMIRIAASEIYLKAEKANLADQVVRLTQSCEKMTLQSATDRAELDKITNEISTRENDITNSKSQLMMSQGTLQQKQSSTAAAEANVNAAKAEIAQLMADIEKAKSEKQQALDAKEEAIKRAVMIGVSGNRAAPPAAAAQPPAQQWGQPAAEPYGQQPQEAQPPAAQPYQPPVATSQPPAAQPYQPPAAQPYQPPAPAAAAYTPPSAAPLEQQPWYFDTISREACEAKLTSGMDGDFMIRKSSRGQNSYSLSVRAAGGAAKHFKVEKDGNVWKLAQKNSDGQTFGSINELVDYYVANGASGVRLGRPVPQAGASFLPAQGGRACWDGGCSGMPMAPDDRFCGGCGKQVHEITKWAP